VIERTNANTKSFLMDGCKEECSILTKTLFYVTLNVNPQKKILQELDDVLSPKKNKKHHDFLSCLSCGNIERLLYNL